MNKCKICDKFFKGNYLQMHIKIVHEKIKQHFCNICQKSFGLKNTLKIHTEMVHEHKKQFKCDLCDYSAFTHVQVRRHIECVHEKLKQHQCSICHLSFSQKGNLKNHIQAVHENNKHYNVIYVIIQLSNILLSDSTLNVSMKISSNTNAIFVKRTLV